MLHRKSGITFAASLYLANVHRSAVSRVELGVQKIFGDQQEVIAQLASLLSGDSPGFRQLTQADHQDDWTPHRLFPDSSIARLDQVKTMKSMSTIGVSDHAMHQTVVVRAFNARMLKRCNSWCSCVCHIRRSLRTPQIFRRALGALFIGYSGLPIINAACNERNCRNRARTLVQLDYHFPTWFLARKLSISMSTSLVLGIEGTLSMPRMVSWSSPLWRMARMGRIDVIQMMFSEGKASPFDVNAYGQSALHVGIVDRAYAWAYFQAVCDIVPSD